MFKKGEDVYSLIGGLGLILDTKEDWVVVQYADGGGTDYYTKEGKFFGDTGHTVLFHGDKLPDWYPKPKRKYYKVLWRDDDTLTITSGYYVDEQEFADTVGEGFVQLLVDDIDYRER